jgi:hypothetical protein
MAIRVPLMDYGNLFFNSRLLASNKQVIYNEMVLKTGNTTMLVKLIESENDLTY